jgi:hypothetical protein
MEQQLLSKIYGLRITKIILQIISGVLVTLLLFWIFQISTDFSPVIFITLGILIFSLIAYVVCLIGLGYLRLKPYLLTLSGAILGIAVFLFSIYVLGDLMPAPS